MRAGAGGRGVRAASARTGGIGAQGERAGRGVAEGGKVVDIGGVAMREAARAYAWQCGRWGVRWGRGPGTGRASFVSANVFRESGTQLLLL